ncbi:MAG: hypothetical protein QXM68_04365 [Candidatus Aenigmatarchaeota archaeon]|nr:hypothetical protein [Candidatus Aenigmarchaeota archaeon]
MNRSEYVERLKKTIIEEISDQLKSHKPLNFCRTVRDEGEKIFGPNEEKLYKEAVEKAADAVREKLSNSKKPYQIRKFLECLILICERHGKETPPNLMYYVEEAIKNLDCSRVRDVDMNALYYLHLKYPESNVIESYMSKCARRYFEAISEKTDPELLKYQGLTLGLSREYIEGIIQKRYK